MRYYAIVITDPKTGKVLAPPSSVPSSGTANYSYSSFVNGRTLPGALQIEMDIPVAAYADPMGAAYVKIWGVSLAEIGQAFDLTGMKIAIYGGMQKGLPLANPAQSGLLTAGMIFQSFGNWIGTDQSLDLILMPDSGTADTPKNIIHNWPAGAPLSDAINTTMQTAFPSYQRRINISPRLVRSWSDWGFYSTLDEYALFVKAASQSIIGDDGYLGVDITIHGGEIVVTDGTVVPPTKQIAFQDLIGQPTWIGAQEVQFKTVMRADIAINDIIKLPPTLATITAQSSAQIARSRSAFQGTFTIQRVRHVGNFRQPAAEAWATTFDCVQTDPTT